MLVYKPNFGFDVERAWNFVWLLITPEFRMEGISASSSAAVSAW